MMPYADQPNDYWSGYFTSRANSKSQIRFASSNLHASNKLYTEKVLDQESTPAQVAEVLDANFAMLDAMGVNQHHDAITGTAKQHVSDNYAELIGSAMATSDIQYVKLIGEKTKEVTGVDASKWEMCSSDNSTYRACPIEEAFEGDFYLTSHNPSTVEQTVQRVKLPPADYSVKVFDQTSSEWTDVNSNLLCSDYEENVDVRKAYETCTLYVKATAAANSKSFFKISKTNKKESKEEVEAPEMNFGCIETSNQKLCLDSKPVIDPFPIFEYTRPDGNVSQLSFKMQWYDPDTGNDDQGNPSGAYLFKPKNQDQKPHTYGKFHKRDILVGSTEDNLVSEMVLYFRDTMWTNDDVYTAHVRLVEGSELLEWEIQMNGISIVFGGREVIAKW